MSDVSDAVDRMETGVPDYVNIETTAMVSIATSLRRIADALEEQRVVESSCLTTDNVQNMMNTRKLGDAR